MSIYRHGFIRTWGIAAALAIAVPAFAQQGTVITSSGERVTGHIRDMDNNGYTVLVNGAERRIMIPEISVVEFADGRVPNASEVDRIRQGREMVVLKDGTALVGDITAYERTMPGRLVDLPMSHAFRIRFDTAGSGERDFLSSDVARIYYKDPTAVLPSMAANTPSTPEPTPTPGVTPEGYRMLIPANEAWTATSLSVRRGQPIRIMSSGQVMFSPNAQHRATPKGSVTGMMATNGPIRQAPVGALIGRIGNGQPFLIGDQEVVMAPASGQLYLGINDDIPSDNSGQFVVTVNTGSTARPR